MGREFVNRVLQLVQDQEIQILFFDLDDTLIRESDYLQYAYYAVAHEVAQGDQDVLQDVQEWMLRRFNEVGRARLLNALCTEFDIEESSISKLLELLRTASTPEGLKVVPWAQELLGKIPRSIKRFVVTNGNPLQQRNKFRQIKPEWVKETVTLICANETYAKPNPLVLLETLSLCAVEPGSALFVGDSEIDELTSARAGVGFLRAPEVSIAVRTRSADLIAQESSRRHVSGS